MDGADERQNRRVIHLFSSRPEYDIAFEDGRLRVTEIRDGRETTYYMEQGFNFQIMDSHGNILNNPANLQNGTLAAFSHGLVTAISSTTQQLQATLEHWSHALMDLAFDPQLDFNVDNVGYSRNTDAEDLHAYLNESWEDSEQVGGTSVAPSVALGTPPQREEPVNMALGVLAAPSSDSHTSQTQNEEQDKELEVKRDAEPPVIPPPGNTVNVIATGAAAATDDNKADDGEQEMESKEEGERTDDPPPLNNSALAPTTTTAASDENVNVESSVQADSSGNVESTNNTGADGTTPLSELELEFQRIHGRPLGPGLGPFSVEPPAGPSVQSDSSLFSRASGGHGPRGACGRAHGLYSQVNQPYLHVPRGRAAFLNRGAGLASNVGSTLSLYSQFEDDQNDRSGASGGVQIVELENLNSNDDLQVALPPARDMQSASPTDVYGNPMAPSTPPLRSVGEIAEIVTFRKNVAGQIVDATTTTTNIDKARASFFGPARTTASLILARIPSASSSSSRKPARDDYSHWHPRTTFDGEFFGIVRDYTIATTGEPFKGCGWIIKFNVYVGSGAERKLHNQLWAVQTDANKNVDVRFQGRHDNSIEERSFTNAGQPDMRRGQIVKYRLRENTRLEQQGGSEVITALEAIYITYITKLDLPDDVQPVDLPPKKL